MSSGFSGDIVFVTGGGRGIGRHITLAFAQEGAHVVINCFRNPDAAEQTLHEVLQAGGSAQLMPGTVADRDSVAGMFDQITRQHGRLDILVNNAAAGRFGPVDSIRDREWTRALSTNTTAALWCAQAARPLLEQARHAAIVNLSSSGAGAVLPAYAGTGVSKAALEALTRYLAVEYGPLGIRVNTVSGGLIEGDTMRMLPDADRLEAAVRAATPLRRVGTPAELAHAVLFLASPAASWITGQVLHADGGLSITHPAYAMTIGTGHGQ
jgi:enoyl-[acyl-carrier protein] reductase III